MTTLALTERPAADLEAELAPLQTQIDQLTAQIADLVAQAERATQAAEQATNRADAAGVAKHLGIADAADRARSVLQAKVDQAQAQAAPVRQALASVRYHEARSAWLAQADAASQELADLLQPALREHLDRCAAVRERLTASLAEVGRLHGALSFEDRRVAEGLQNLWTYLGPLSFERNCLVAMALPDALESREERLRDETV